MEQGEELRPEALPLKERLQYQPKISIVVPVLNRVDELPHLFTSLKQQTYEGEIEIVVADAGSTDGTIKLCKEEGITVVNAPKEKGIGATRKAGCDEATGEILVNTDSDTSLTPGFLDAVAEAFSDPDVIASHGPLKFTYQGKPPIGLKQSLAQKMLERDMEKRHQKGQPMLAGPNFAILKRVYQALGGFDSRTERIEEPVLYQLLWEMPGKIVRVEGQRVQTELPWQDKGQPSWKKFREYKRKNQRWIPIAIEVINERKKNLPEMREKVEKIIEDRRTQLAPALKEPAAL